MFISVLEIFKIGIGPSSSHTMGPMVAAVQFLNLVKEFLSSHTNPQELNIKCTLKGSLAFTGKGHATDRAVALGLHGDSPESLIGKNVNAIVDQIWKKGFTPFENNTQTISFFPDRDIIFDKGEPLPDHPNGMIFELLEQSGEVLLSETYFSVGGGFILSKAEMVQLVAPLKLEPEVSCKYAFDSALSMLELAEKNGLSFADMKRANEVEYISEEDLNEGLDSIWKTMKTCVENGLKAEGHLPGGLNLPRRAKNLYRQLLEDSTGANINEWLCAYAMAVSEENAMGHTVVTAPTNGAAGVIPAILYYFVTHEGGTVEQVHDLLLTASAIGGLIKHRSSISGAEVGCQGEVGSAASMAAAGLCAVKGGTPEQIENAAEIALEHHLGMTCDPVNGLVQVPCIERNGFGAVKAYTAMSLAMRESGEHFMPLDACIAAMKQTGLEMSDKFKETSLGGLAVSITEC